MISTKVTAPGLHATRMPATAETPASGPTSATEAAAPEANAGRPPEQHFDRTTTRALAEGPGVLAATRKQPPTPQAAGTFSYDDVASSAAQKPSSDPGLTQAKAQAQEALKALNRAMAESAKAEDTKATHTVDVLATRPTMGPNGPTTESVAVGKKSVENPEKQRANDAALTARLAARSAIKSLNESLDKQPAFAGLERVDPRDLVTTNPMSFARALPIIEQIARHLERQ